MSSLRACTAQSVPFDEFFIYEKCSVLFLTDEKRMYACDLERLFFFVSSFGGGFCYTSKFSQPHFLEYGTGCTRGTTTRCYILQSDEHMSPLAYSSIGLCVNQSNDYKNCVAKVNARARKKNRVHGLRCAKRKIMFRYARIGTYPVFFLKLFFVVHGFVVSKGYIRTPL